MTGTLIDSHKLEAACISWLKENETSSLPEDIKYVKQLKTLAKLNLITTPKSQIPIPTALFVDAKAAELLFNHIVKEYSN